MIDTARLAELRDEIGAEDLAEVVGMFCDEVEEALAALDALAPDDLLAHLHFLKGSALNVGLSAVSDLCREAERGMRSDPGHRPDIALIQRTYAQSKQALLADL